MPEIEQDGSLPSTKTRGFFRQRLFAGDVDVDLAGVGVGWRGVCGLGGWWVGWGWWGWWWSGGTVGGRAGGRGGWLGGWLADWLAG